MIPLLFGAALVLFFSPKSREKCRHPVPEPPSPDTKVRDILPRMPTSTVCLTLAAVVNGHVQSPAERAWLHLVQAHKQWFSCLSRPVSRDLGSGRILQFWDLDKGSIPDGSCGEAPCFVPICLGCMFCTIAEKIRMQTVWLRQSLGMKSLLPLFL